MAGAHDLMEAPDELCSEVFINDLPPELLIHLFSYMDGISLIRLSCLCKKFLNVANTVWEPIFKRELEESVLDVAPGIYKGLHRPQHFFSQNVPWKKLFVSVMIWQSMKNWDVTVFLSEDMTSDEILCLGVAGSETVWGTKRGFVFKMSKEDLSEIECISQHDAKINNLVVQVTSENDYDNEELRYRIVTISEDRCIQINDLDYGHSMRNTINFENIVGIQDNLYEWSTKSNIIFDLRVDILRKRLSRARLEMQLPSPSLCGRVMAIDPSQNLIICHRSGPLTWDSVSKSWTTVISKLQSIRVQQGYIFSNGISVSITTDFNMIVTVGREGALVMWPELMRPTSALLHGQVFIVGTETGFLFLYFLKSRNDILKLSPTNFDAKFDTNQCHSILHLAISEADENHPLPDIHAASRYQIICIRAMGFKK